MSQLLPGLFLFASIGVINGFLLAFFILSGDRRKVWDFYFAGLLLALCLRIGKSVYLHFFEDVDRLVLQTGLSAGLFIGPFFYLMLKSRLRQDSHFRKWDIGLLSFLFISILLIGIVYPYRNYPLYWNAYFVYGIYGIWALFCALGLYEARTLISKLFRIPQKLNSPEKQLIGIILGMLFITLTYQFALYISGITYIWGALGFTTIFYLLLFQHLKRRYWKRPSTIPNHIQIDTSRLLQQIDQLMEEHQPYKNPKLKLEELAQLTDLNKNQLSRLLNDHYPNGFSQYVNQWRVEEAKQLIAQKEELSLEGIGYEAGFNSKSSFFATFKKITQYTPAQYKKALKKT